MADNDVFVTAHVDREDERAAAQSLLRDAVEYEGMVEGWASPETIEEMRAKGMCFTIVRGESAVSEDPLERRSKYTDPDLQDRLLELAHKGEVEAGDDALESLSAAPMAAPAPVPSGPQPYKVTLTGPIRSDWRSQLGNLGAEIAGHHRGTYRMFIEPDQVDAVRALPYVKDVSEHELTDTVSSSVLLRLEEKKEQAETGGLESLGEEEPETFDVFVHRENDLPLLVEFLQSRDDAEIVEQSASGVRIRAAAEADVVAAVAKLPQVRTVVHTKLPTLYVNRAREIVGLVKVNQALPPKEWNGKGEVVAVLDSGIDATHPDFEGQFHVEPISFRGCSVEDKVGHGTHVGGIIAGTGKKSDGTICGVAPGAKLVVVGMVDELEVPQIPLDIGELLKVAVDAGAKIINASWGRRLGSSYDAGSRSVDKFIHEHPDVLVVVAAGNEGEAPAPKGTYKFSSIGAPATAKNVLTVGASVTDRGDITGTWGTFRPSTFPAAPARDDVVSGDPDKVAGISSRGPTDYDSIKPDVIAPGTYILAPRAKGFKKKLQWKPHETTDYVYVGGTSMATPVVSGLAAVLRQYLREERNVANPSAALLKAILIGSAKPVPQRTDPAIKKIGYPDFDQGFGRVDLSSIIPDVDNPAPRRLLFVDVPNDSPLALESRAPKDGVRKSSRTYKVKATKKGPLVITLAWTDPPGNDVQNNLQLDVRGPGDILKIGNEQHIFRKDPEFDDVSPNGVVLDKRNNIEQIRVPDAEPGEYVVRVFAHNTVLPPQGYALAVVGSVEGDLV